MSTHDKPGYIYTFKRILLRFASVSSQRAKRKQSESERYVYAPLHRAKKSQSLTGVPKNKK